MHSGAEYGQYFSAIEPRKGEVFVYLLSAFLQRHGGAYGHFVIGGEQPLKVGMFAKRFLCRLVAAANAVAALFGNQNAVRLRGGVPAPRQSFARSEQLLIAVYNGYFSMPGTTLSS